MNKITHKIPEPEFNYGDIVLAPRWRFGIRRFVIAEIVGRNYIYPGGLYYEGYSDGWRYKVKYKRKVWDEKFAPRLKLLVRKH